MLEPVVHSSFKNRAHRRLAALLCACTFGLIAAGCHNNNIDSGFGVIWPTLTTTDDAGQFTNYLVSVDSVELVGKLNGTIPVVSIPELVDFAKLTNLSELWGTADMPVDTYTSAIITLDYTGAQVSVMVNGAPVQATLVDPTGVTPTIVVVTVNLDSSDLLTLLPTFATSNALRLAVNFDLSASNTIDFTTSPPTVTVKPFLSVSTTASDNKLIRVRGDLINSSLGEDTYSIVTRPFFDEVNSLGSMTMFNDTNTVYALNGTTYVGPAGLTLLSQMSAGTTMTAAFTTFEPTTTPTAGVAAGIFHSVYVVAGSSLEDLFSEGIEDTDVIARNGNVLTVRGGTLFSNAIQFIQDLDQDSQVILGPATQVTADGIATSSPLDFNSISVGQHITARGIYSTSAAGAAILDSTGASADTGLVRLQSTQVFGSLISEGTGSLALNLQSIQNWPASIYDFAGNGVSAAQDSSAANYMVNTGALALPAAAAGDPLWIDGLTSPFGSAPPDFNATAVNAEPTVPATLIVVWTGTGTAAPFATLTSSSLTIDLANAALGTGLLRIGAENIDITTLSGSPSVVPASATQANGLPLFTPVFSIGPGVSAESTSVPIQSFNGFADFVTVLTTTFAATTPTTRFMARGLYNRAANTFTASAIDVVL